MALTSGLGAKFSSPAAGIRTLPHSSSWVGAPGGLSPCSQVSSEILPSRSSTCSGAAAAVARSRSHRHRHSNAAGEQQVQLAGAASTSTASTSAALSPPRRQQPRTMPPPPCRRRRCRRAAAVGRCVVSLSVSGHLVCTPLKNWSNVRTWWPVLTGLRPYFSAKNGK